MNLERHSVLVFAVSLLAPGVAQASSPSTFFLRNSKHLSACEDTMPKRSLMKIDHTMESETQDF